MLDSDLAPRTPLRRIEWLLDESAASRTRPATGMRIAIALLFAGYGILTEALSIWRDGDVTLTGLMLVLGAAAIASNRLGRIGRYFLPVGLGAFAYGTASPFVTRFHLGVHYRPQLWLEQHLTPGPIPTVWLQEHLYHGRTGPLEVFAVAMYLGHFLVPLALAAGLALTNRAREFKLLMFTLLAVLLLGLATFVLAPTAPPWLAAEHGYLRGVHEILKSSLPDMHMRSLARFIGDPSKYDVVAALPSLHTAFPLICLLVALHGRLPRWVSAALALDLLGVVFSIVYTGEHYLVDALAGALYAGVAWTAVRAAERRAGRPAAEPARAAAEPEAGLA